jgi:hypothetical protein
MYFLNLLVICCIGKATVIYNIYAGSIIFFVRISKAITRHHHIIIYLWSGTCDLTCKKGKYISLRHQNNKTVNCILDQYHRAIRIVNSVFFIYCDVYWFPGSASFNFPATKKYLLMFIVFLFNLSFRFTISEFRVLICVITWKSSTLKISKAITRHHHIIIYLWSGTWHIEKVNKSAWDIKIIKQ